MNISISKINSGSLKEYLPAAVCLLFTFVLLVVLTFSPTGKSDLAVVYPPGTDATEGFIRTVNSGAYATGEGTFENIVIVKIPDLNNAQRIIDELYKSGALIIIDGIAARGCFN